MELLQLRYFYTVGKMLNISRAAKVHGIPQPAMSKMMSKFEASVGVPLFDRTKNHITLTRAGQLLLSDVEKSLHYLDLGIKEAEAQKDYVSGNLRLSVLYHRNTIIRCIERFTKDHPNVNFSVFNNSTEPGPFDLCIGGPRESEHYDSSIPLLKEEIRLAVPHNHPLANKASISMDDVRQEKFIIPSYDNQMFQLFSALAKDAGFLPRVAIVSNDLYCIRQYFNLGMGLSLVPRFSWSTLFANIGQIISFETPIYRTVHMFWNMHNISKPSVALFQQYVKAEFNNIGQETHGDISAPMQQ